MDAPSIRLCDCPNGCVLLQFGYVTIHLPRAAFLAFARQSAQVAVALVHDARAVQAEG